MQTCYPAARRADQVNEELTAEIEKLSGELVKLP
jgi:hypothetical protein